MKVKKLSVAVILMAGVLAGCTKPEKSQEVSTPVSVSQPVKLDTSNLVPTPEPVKEGYKKISIYAKEIYGEAYEQYRYLTLEGEIYYDKDQSYELEPNKVYQVKASKKDDEEHAYIIEDLEPMKEEVTTTNLSEQTMTYLYSMDNHQAIGSMLFLKDNNEKVYAVDTSSWQDRNLSTHLDLEAGKKYKVQLLKSDKGCYNLGSMELLAEQ